jgi:flagellar biosynthesis protein FlhB
MGDKVHPPSQQKLSTARARGEIWRATLLAQVVGIIVLYVAIVVSKTMVLDGLNNLLQLGGLSTPDSEFALVAGLWLGVGWACTVLGCAALASIVVFCALGGFVMSSVAVTPNFARLDPVSGFQRLVCGAKDGWQLVVRFVCATLISVALVGGHQLIRDPSSVLGSALWGAAAALLVCGIFDAVLRRRRYISDQMMTDDELRREMRESEGDPLMKSMQRSMRESLSRGEMIARLKRARVLIVGKAQRGAQ